MTDFNTAASRKAHKNKTPITNLKMVHTEQCIVLPNRHYMIERLPRNAVVAEIGVAFGDFTKAIIDVSRPTQLHLIDLWGNERYEAGFGAVHQRFNTQILDGSVQISRGHSIEQLEKFDDHYFDWVYIDTNHLFNNTFRELLICNSKVKKNGFIAGHDFCTGNVIDAVPYGVIEACAKFCVDFGWYYKYLALESNGHFSFCLQRL